MIFTKTWYRRGRLATNPWFNLEEKGDDYEPSLYFPENVDDLQHPSFAEVHQNMHTNEPNCDSGCQIIPWVTFGEGFVQLPKDPNLAYVGDLVYDPNVSWQLGSWLNDPNYEPDDPNLAANDVVGVVIYGNPLGTPDFFMQFKAYVQGACGIDPNSP